MAPPALLRRQRPRHRPSSHPTRRFHAAPPDRRPPRCTAASPRDPAPPSSRRVESACRRRHRAGNARRHTPTAATGEGGGGKLGSLLSAAASLQRIWPPLWLRLGGDADGARRLLGGRRERLGGGGRHVAAADRYEDGHCGVPLILCQACLLPLKPPIFKCETAGNIVCSFCRGGHGDTCSRADTRCGELDAFGLPRSRQGALPYRQFGCDRYVVYHGAAEGREHQHACPCAPCSFLSPKSCQHPYQPARPHLSFFCSIIASPPSFLPPTSIADLASQHQDSSKSSLRGSGGSGYSQLLPVLM
nr:uncharacterized protein LOC127339225 [Lolium perenne]